MNSYLRMAQMQSSSKSQTTFRLRCDVEIKPFPNETRQCKTIPEHRRMDTDRTTSCSRFQCHAHNLCRCQSAWEFHHSSASCSLDKLVEGQTMVRETEME